MDELREEIRRTLRRNILGDDLAEAKSASSWWDGMLVVERKKVANILGFSKGKDRDKFSKLSPGERSEVEAYQLKHKGGQG